ncbi:Zinc finger C3H1 domain-containing protein [Haplosporangium sp. Z 27]|nr:Zinc finger C3H1 domain-containing protein [Haplosporangium sp. Z 27]
MSRTPTDLDALRAAVLMSRRQPVQNKQIAPNVNQSTAETLSSRTEPSINFGSNSILNSTPKAASSLDTFSAFTPTASTTENSYVSISNGFNTATSAANHIPATSSKSLSSQPADKEDGEISDEESEVEIQVETRKELSIDPVSSANNIPETRPIPSNATAIESQMSTAPASQALLGRPSPLNYPAPAERALMYTQRPTNPVKPSVTTNSVTSKGKTKSMSDDYIPLGQDSDFTTLIEEYQLQKAKTDSKPQIEATNQDQLLDSEIPGLGHFKTLPFSDLSSSERNSRRQPNTGRRPGDIHTVPKNQRTARITKKRQRDTSINIKQPQPTSSHSHHDLPRHWSDPNSNFVISNSQVDNNQLNNFSQMSSLHQASSQRQIYTLVEELLGYGITPEYLLQSGIDPTVVNNASGRIITPLASPVTPVGTTQSFHVNPQAITLANLQQTMRYPQSSGISMPQSSIVSVSQPSGRVHEHLQSTVYSRQTNPTDVPRSQSIQPNHTQMPQTQNTLSQQQSVLPPPNLNDGDASKALEMILAYAARILPQGWHSLVPQGGGDLASTSVNTSLPETGLEFASSSYSTSGTRQNNMPQMTCESLRPVKMEQDVDRSVLLARNTDQNDHIQAGPASWNISEEATYTTAKFQDLSISPNQQMQNQSTTITSAPFFQAHIPSQNLNASTHFHPEERPSINNAFMSANNKPPVTFSKHDHFKDVESTHDTSSILSTAFKSTLPSYPPPPPTHPPPSPPPPPTSAPPSPPPPPPSSTPPPGDISPYATINNSTTSRISAMEADTRSSLNNNSGSSRNVKDDSTNLTHLSGASKEQGSGDAESRRSSTLSQDDTDMDIDLDDDSTEPTILKGSWKTTEDVASTTAISSSQPVSKRPTHIRFDGKGKIQLLQVNSAPILTSQIDTQESSSQSYPTMSRLHRNGRRITAKDFMAKSSSSTPFIQERALSYLIDIDDDDDGEDEPRAYTPSVKSSTPMSRADSVNSPQESRTLQDIQQQLKELNERILAKQRAKRSALSALALDGSTQRDSSTRPTSRSETESPAQPSGDSSNSEDQAMEKAPEMDGIAQESIDNAEELRRAISEHKVSLEGLRSQKQQYEQDKAAAINSLADLTSDNSKYQDYDKLRSCLDEAAEKVALKTRELEDAKRHFEETKARIEPLLSQQSHLEHTKERLQERIDMANEKTDGLKGSIGVLQQNIIQMRTRLMILEGKSRLKSGTNMNPLISAIESPHATSQDSSSDAGPKRGIESQGQISDENVKKPRTQREEFSALSKRMQELEREKDLLRLTATPVPSSHSSPITKVTTGAHVHSDPAAATNGSSVISPQQPEKSKIDQSSSLHLSSLGSGVSDSKVVSSAPTTDSNVKSTATSKNLSRLDEFLAQDKSLPVTRASENDARSSSPSWQPTSSIKKLHLAEACLFEFDQLCVPSELIKYVIPDRQCGMQPDVLSVQGKSEAPGSESTKDTLDYVSPLSMFRSFRFSSKFRDAVRDGYKSLTYSNKIDPMKPMCLYELSGGSCNDDSCKSQHARDYELTDEELVIDMARYAEGSTVESRQMFADMQSAKLAHLRAAGIHNTELLIDSIVKNHRDFVQDSSRTVKFGERVITENDPTDAITRNKPKGRSGDRAVDRLIESSKASSSSLDQNPIIMEILSKALTKPVNKNRRYHEQQHPDDFEKLIQSDPSNETLWIEYAISHLSAMSASDTDERKIHNALSVISRALGVHPASEGLWGLYLDLYTRHGAELETRQMFEQCLHYIPDAQLIWFRYFLWEKGRDERVYVLDRMLERACQEPRKADDEAARSRFTLDVVLQIVKTMVSENFVESAKNWMQNFLTCASWESIVPSSLSYAQLDDVWVEQDMVENISGTLAAKLLKPSDHCVLWLAFVYLIWFHELPDQLFLDYPNNYISENSMFVIHWPEIDEPEQESELHSIVHDIFLGLTVYFVDCDARSPLVAIVKNFVGFLIARGQQQEEILELVNPSQFPESFPEIRDLFCQVRMNAEAKRDLQQAIQELPMQPYLWNRYARLQPVESKRACLEQCAYEFFKVESNHEVGVRRSELAILLYKKLLGLELPYSYETPPTRTDITPFKTNVFLWLNYLSLLALESENYGSSQLEVAFSFAIETLPANKLWVIQTELAVHSIMKGLCKVTGLAAINSIVAAAIGDFNTSRPNPYDHSTTEEAKGDCNFRRFKVAGKYGPNLKSEPVLPIGGKAKHDGNPNIHDIPNQQKPTEARVSSNEEAPNGHQALDSQELDSGSDMEMDN